MSPNFHNIVAGEVCGYRLGGMLRRSRVAQHRDELHLDVKRRSSGGSTSRRLAQAKHRRLALSTANRRREPHHSILPASGALGSAVPRPKSAETPDAAADGNPKEEGHVDGPDRDAHELLAHADAAGPPPVALGDPKDET